MRNLIYIFISLTLLAISCRSKNNENSSDLIKNVYSTDNLPTQTFSISSDSDTTLKGNSGTILRIYKNTFVDNKGQIVIGLVKIELKEVLTPLDMILGNLTTTSNGEILQSGGMIFVTATLNGEQVEIAYDKFIGAIIPSEKVLPEMKIFEGKLDSNRINWVTPKTILNDKLINRTDTIAEINSKDTSKLGQLAPIQQFNEDVFLQEIQQSKGENYYVEDYNINYIFTIKKLGWANIDRLYSDPRTKDVELITKIENKNEFQMIYVTMIISNQGMYLPGYQMKDETFSFTHEDSETTQLPIGETATILATTYKNGITYFAIKTITITDKQIVSLKLNETTMEKLKAELKVKI